MHIREIMKTAIITCETSQSVRSAAQMMARNNVGALIVVNNGDRVGIFTERDVINRVLAADKNVDSTAVGEVMTTKLHTLDAEHTIGQAHHSLVSHKVRHMPVMEKGTLVGFVSTRDIAEAIDEKLAELMTPRQDYSGDY